jgi:disulfide bond formation protein DsbB
MVSSAATITPPLPGSERGMGLAAAAVAVATLAAAVAIERLLDLPPCSLCTYQRWAYVGVIVFGIAAAATGRRRGVATILVGLAGAAFLTGAGIAGFHVGVEHGWWESIDACAGQLSDVDITQLQQRLQNLQAPPPCDEVRWRLFGLFSLAELNAAASLLFGIVTLVALARVRRQR